MVTRVTSLASLETVAQQGEKLWFQTLWLLRSRPPFSLHLLPQSFLFLLPHPLGPFLLLRILLLRRRRCLGLQVQVLDLQLVSELLLPSLHRSLVLPFQVLQLLLLLLLLLLLILLLFLLLLLFLALNLLAQSK